MVKREMQMRKKYYDAKQSVECVMDAHKNALVRQKKSVIKLQK